MRYLLDTNTVSYFFRGEGQVAAHMSRVPPAQIAIPAVVVFEIRYGLLKTPIRRIQAQFEELLRWITVVPFDHETTVHAAKVRANAERRGRPIGAYDTLIAATALQFESILVTRNVSEFRFVEGLQLADWFNATGPNRPLRINEPQPPAYLSASACGSTQRASRSISPSNWVI
jgi:tRNA(fMet)-specific endonuclease VapC